MRGGVNSHLEIQVSSRYPEAEPPPIIGHVRLGVAMDILVVTVQLGAVMLLLYGISLCAWMAYLRSISELQRQPATPRGRKKAPDGCL